MPGRPIPSRVADAEGLQRVRPCNLPLSMTAEPSHERFYGRQFATAILHSQGLLIAVIRDVPHLSAGTRSATIAHIGFKAAST
jgi:hypothetical protein